MKNKISIVKWASSSFLFESDLKLDYEVEEINITHHKNWLSKDKSILLEFFHIFRQFSSIFIKAFFSNYLIFGTNACRLLYFQALFNDKIFLVLNEIPSNFTFIDNYFIKKLSKQIYMSNHSRVELFTDKYKVDFGGVLPNLPILRTNSKVKKSNNKIIYAGLISNSRLDNSAVQSILDSGLILDLVGYNLNFDMDSINGEYFGLVSQIQAQEIQSSYSFGLLSYPLSDLNNNYCAPIKIYEYINNNCVCVLVNRNVGLQFYMENYPSLFVLLDDLKSYVLDEEEYEKQRRIFFENENILLNETLSKMKMSWG